MDSGTSSHLTGSDLEVKIHTANSEKMESYLKALFVIIENSIIQRVLLILLLKGVLY